MEVFLIRHGHALHNRAYELFGESAYFSDDYAYSTLTEKGHQQTLSVRVPRTPLIYCSPLIRCIQSARNIFGSQANLHLHDGLIETQGEHPCNKREPLNLMCAKYPNINTDFMNPTYVFEKESNMKERVENTLTQIIEHARSQNVSRIAIITHHDVLEILTGVSLKNAEAYRMYVPEDR